MGKGFKGEAQVSVRGMVGTLTSSPLLRMPPLKVSWLTMIVVPPTTMAAEADSIDNVASEDPYRSICFTPFSSMQQ
jgi:hypothetical protein